LPFNRLAKVSLKRNISCFLFFLFSLCLSSEAVFSSSEEENTKKIVAEEVYIPKYGGNGQIIWTLNAEEVNPGVRDSYNVVGPILKTLDQRKNITQVSAQKGVFDLEKDRAFGSEKINIDGSGFRLEGEHWKWQQDQEGRHNFKIGKEGFAFFENSFESSGPSILPKKQKEDLKISASTADPIVASASEIELVSLRLGGHRIQLSGFVTISSNEMEINCSQMTIFIDRNASTSLPTKGRITQITADENVEMRQLNRSSSANSLTFDTLKGEILMEGDVVVDDQEWGRVVGEKIILEQRTGRVRVLGNEKARPRIELPDLGKIKLPKPLMKKAN
jgi:lipopolysaccharide export system protein LptA